MPNSRLARVFGPLAVGLLLQAALPVPAPASSRLRSAARANSASGRQIRQLQEQLRRYGDGQEKTAARITLQQALVRGLRTNPVLRKAYAAIEEADWSVVAIQREWWPGLSAGNDDPGLLGWTTTTTKERVRSASGTSETLTVNGGQSSVPNLSLDWTFFDPSRASRSNAARSQLIARRFLFDVDARDLILQIQLAYYTLQEQAELEQDYRRLSKTLAELVDSIDPGHRDPGAFDQLLTEQLSVLNLRISTHEDVIRAADALAEAISLPPGALVMPADPLQLQGRWDTPLPEAIRQALALREEIQASLAQAGGAAWSARARQRGYLPTLSLSGQLSGTTETVAGGSLIGPFEASSSLNREIESQVGIGFDWTIFDGGILSSEAEGLRARSRAALAQADLDRLSVTRQVRDNQAALLSSLIVVESAAEQLATARRSLDAACRDFRSGRADATRIVQASSSLVNAAATYRGAVRKHNSAIAGLYRHSARWPEGTADLLSGSFPRLAAPTRPVPPP